MRRLFAALAFAAALASGAKADPATLAAVQEALYAGDTAAAIAAAGTRVEAAPDDAQARFALGAAQFLGAVEGLARNLHRHGLRGASDDSFGGLVELPFLRVPVPPNPDPAPLAYEGFRAILDEFVDALAVAEATLAAVPPGEADLPLELGRIRLDLDGDGTAGESETLWRIFAAIAGASWLDADAAAGLAADFDAADAPWLRAYCHLLSAMAEFLLAHDWRPAFDATFHGVFPDAGLPSARLNEMAEAASNEGNAEGGAFEEFGNQMQSAFAAAADAIAFLHLNHWPVAEPERLAAALAHLEAMPQLSRASWDLILAETDDRNEWIPNPMQTGVLPDMVVGAEQIEGWMLFLDEFEALLAGEKLLPHWRFRQGVNLRRMFLEPQTFDLVLLIQGSGVLPYLEDGELTDRETWMLMTQLLGGDFFRYAVWFN
jgi:hypothetical protein